MDGSLLWVYEGLTQYWGTVLPVRAGLIPAAEHREMLASLAGTFDVESGDRWRPLADTAVEAQILYDASPAWESSRRSVDFYEASEFLWLNVDAELRARSAGRASLDDFMQRFYAGAGGAPALKPYVEADVYGTLAAIAPGDWRALIRSHLDTLGPQALLAGLESAGWRLSYSADKNAYVEARDKRRKVTNRQWSIGLTIDDKGRIVDTVEDRAAARAGAGPGMKLVAVNGHRMPTTTSTRRPRCSTRPLLRRTRTTGRSATHRKRRLLPDAVRGVLRRVALAAPDAHRGRPERGGESEAPHQLRRLAAAVAAQQRLPARPADGLAWCAARPTLAVTGAARRP